MRIRLVCLAVALLCFVAPSTANRGAAPAGSEPVTFVVKLLTPLGTKGSLEGDTFTTLVVEPVAFATAEVEGKITRLKKPEKGARKGAAQLSFEFRRMKFKEQFYDIQAELVSVTNSQGVKDVDEEGHVISKTNKKKRVATTAAGSAVGAIIGGIAGGGKGAAIGAAAGAAGGLLVGITMTAAASDIEFSPGTLLTLSVTNAPEASQPGQEKPEPAGAVPLDRR